MHSPELIREFGDYLEQHNATNILTRLPGYALFWTKYIGNDGSSNYLPMPGATSEVLKARIELWEHLYTLFESFALCWRLEDRFNECKKIASPSEYADNLNDWIAFFAHLGRIHDMAEKAAANFKGENLYAPFDPFYEQRHTVLHYPKVPMAWVENVLAGPRIAEKPKHWQQKMRWNEMKPDDFEFLDVIVSSTMRSLELITNKYLFEISELAQRQLHFTPVKWPARPSSEHISEDNSDFESDDSISKLGDDEPPRPSSVPASWPPPSGC